MTVSSRVVRRLMVPAVALACATAAWVTAQPARPVAVPAEIGALAPTSHPPQAAVARVERQTPAQDVPSASVKRLAVGRFGGSPLSAEVRRILQPTTGADVAPTAGVESDSIGKNHTGAGAEPIPFDQLGAMAGKQYSGDGLKVAATEDGAVLHSVFQTLDAAVTTGGLTLTSTAPAGGRMRLTAAALRRGDLVTPLAADGRVDVTDTLVTYTRPGLTEQFSTSADGVRQDFVIADRPEGDGPVMLELTLSGATARADGAGVALMFDGSGRELTYGRLRVTDSTGAVVAAAFSVIDETHVGVRLEDADASYPVRVDPTFSDADWVSLNPGIPGVNGVVFAVASDGFGNLYVGGSFTVAGTVAANCVAKWDGSSWSPLGLGTTGAVYALAVNGTDVYVGGAFNAAGGSTANRFIAKWNGATWSALGTGRGSSVYALALSGTDLYVGGAFFATISTPGQNYVAKWNGTSWSALGTGVNGTVWALAISGAHLLTGGDFTTADGTTVNRVARWDGSSWSALGAGTNGSVYALATDGADVYAGGAFTAAGGTPASRVARWNGISWSALGTGFGNPVLALAMSGAEVVAGGQFGTGRIATWNGTSWSFAGQTIAAGGSTHAIASIGSDVYVGGSFVELEGAPTLNIARWDRTAWQVMGFSGLPGSVAAVAAKGGELYIAGYYTSTETAVLPYLARWDGSSWSPLGAGVNGRVLALAVSGADVYAGGVFTMAGGVAASNVAKWNGASWSPLGVGVDIPVYAIALRGTDVFVGGGFNNAGPVQHALRLWNGGSWSSLGGFGGSGGTVYAIAVTATDVYAGGDFTFVGGVPANRVAKWNGTSWSSLGLGMNGPVFALAASGSDLYAGGQFSMSGIAPTGNVAKWNGASWSSLGPATWYSGTLVSALAVDGADVYVGGSFISINGVLARSVAKWNGASWSALGSGLDGAVGALAVHTDRLVVGGSFYVAGTNTVSPFIVQANIVPTPIADAGADQTVTATSPTGASVTLAGSASVGTTFTWRDETNAVVGNTADITVTAPLGVHTFTLTVGNSANETSTDTVTVTVEDLFSISIGSPAPGSYTAGDVIAAAFTCSDAANSIASCIGTVPNGANIDTSTPGEKLFTVTATNTVGTTSSMSVTYTVTGAPIATTTVVTCPASVSYTGTPRTPCTATVTGAGLSLSGMPVHENNVGVGTAQATYDYPGDANYLASSGTATFAIVNVPSSTTWSPLGTGADGQILALAVSGPDVYAGGEFTTAGDVTVNYVARWNGSSWSPLGAGMDGRVTALAVIGSDLYAGGEFATAGGVAANHVAKWNGTSWEPLGSGTDGTVYALAVIGTDLYAGGTFTTAGGVPASNIARWNGSSWSPLGAGTIGAVYSLAVRAQDLFVGGDFTAGLTVPNHVMQWSGGTWSSLGGGIDSAWVLALAVNGSDVFAGLQPAEYAPGVSHVVKWSGTSWQPIGPELNYIVRALAVSGQDLYAGGYFGVDYSGSPFNGIARWDGTSWFALGSGVSEAAVLALAAAPGRLLVGGGFVTAGGIAAPFIAQANLVSAPIAHAGVDQTATATSATGASVTLTGAGSSGTTFAWRDDTNAVVATTQDAVVTVPLGTHTFTLTVGNTAGATATDTVVITVEDLFTITIASPASASSYGLGQIVPASYTCTDSASSIASCVGTVQNGASIDTSSVGAKSFTVTATNTFGATASQTVTYVVSAAATTTVVSCPASVVYMGSALTPCTVSVTGAGLSVAPTPVYLDNVDAGTAQASYSYPGDADHQASSGSATFTIERAASTVAVSFEPGPYAYRGTAFSATANVTGVGGLSLSLPVTYGGDCTNVTTPAGCAASATFGGDANHLGSSASANITITPGTATVTLANLSQAFTGGPLAPTATTNPPGLAVTIAGAPQTNAGSYAVTATVNDANYTGTATGTFTIAKAQATVTLANLTQTFTGGPLSPTVTTVPSGLVVALSGAPQTSVGSYPVTATVNDANYQGSATGTFAIAPASAAIAVTVVSPNGGEARYLGSPSRIRWTASGALAFDVAYSSNGGTTYTNIPGCVGLPGSTTECQWTPTGAWTSAARVRVTARDASGAAVNDASNGTFVVLSGSPGVVVVSPNTAVSWGLGSTWPIAWVHNLGANALFRVELTRDGGSTWTTLSPSVAGSTVVTGTFAWTVTGPLTTAARVRVTWLDGAAVDVSDRSFSVVTPAIKVTAPNTATSWTVGSTRTISWTSTLDPSQTVAIDISRDGGVTWAPLVASAPNVGIHAWVVSGPVTSTARVRVRWTANAAVQDVSDVNFVVRQ